MFVKRLSFAQARRAAGFTQESLAERLGVDRTTVARWESGEYSPQPWLRPPIAEAFGVSLSGLRELVDGVGEAETAGQTVGVATTLVKADGAPVPQVGAEQVSGATLEHAGLSRAMKLAGAYTGVKAPLRTTTGLPQTPWDIDQLAVLTAHAIVACSAEAAEREDRLYEQLKNILGEWAVKIDRRKLLGLLGWAAATVATSPIPSLDSDDQERLKKAIALPRRVDGRVVDNIEALFRHCKLQEDALGSRLVLATVLAQRGIVDALLKDCPDELRPRLLSVYSDMSTSIGYYFFESNDLASARYYCDQARMAAHDAGNTELGIYALSEMSYFASWQGKAPAAIDLAASAESLLRTTDDPLMRVAVAQRSATAYAIDGQYKTCMVQLERAQATLLSAGNVSAESPLYFYNEGYLASHKSECLLRLGKSQEAAVGASAGLTLYDQSFVDGYAVCTLHLGNAYLQVGEIDEAAQVIGSAAALSAQTHSARLTREVRLVRGQMEPWKDTLAVRELDERLAGAGFDLTA